MHQFIHNTKVLVLSFVLACLGMALPSLVHAATIVVDTPVDSVDPSDNRCSLREAIANANANLPIHVNCPAGTGADTIQFSLLFTTTTIALSSPPGEFDITDTLTIDGANGGNRVTIDGTGDTDIFDIGNVSNTISVSITTLRLTNGTAFSGGAVSVNNANLNIENSAFEGNTSTFLDGGALHVDTSTVTISNSSFTNNKAGFSGGVIHAISSTLQITNSSFISNLANISGGGIDFVDSTFQIQNSEFISNTTDGSDGGAISCFDGTLNVTDSTFTSNESNTDGGAISTDNCPSRLIRSSFVSNASENNGAAIYATNPITMEILDSNFNLNTASADGGAISIEGEGDLTRIENSVLISNTAGGVGGAINIVEENFIEIEDTTFTLNLAGRDGGAISNEGGSITIENSTLFQNKTSNGDGGAIYSTGYNTDSGGIVNVMNSTLSENQAGNGRGGAIFGAAFDDDNQIAIHSSTIIKNQASELGGGIYSTFSNSLGNATVELTNTILVGNLAGDPSINSDDCYNSTNFAGSIVESAGNNLVGLNTHVNCGIVATDKQVDPGIIFTEVLDETLADNGGPTPTHALLPGSPAIDAGGNCPPPNTDQRGEPRISPCDIGAYEAKVYALRLTTSASTSFVGLPVTITASVVDQFNNPPSSGLSVSFEISGLNPSIATVPLNGPLAITTFKREVNTGVSTPIRAWLNLDSNFESAAFEPSDTVTVTWRPVTMTVDGQGVGTDVEVLRTILVSVRSEDLTEPVPGIEVGFDVIVGNPVPTEISKTNTLGQVIFRYVSRAPLSVTHNSTNEQTDIRPAQVNATGCGGILPPTSTDVIRVWVDLIANRTPDSGEPFFLCEVRSAITLAAFTAHLQDGAIRLDWTTAIEIDNAGFNLYRAPAPEGPYSKINQQLIAGQGTGYGASYNFVDTPLTAGPFYYKLEDVDYNGKSTFHGPITAGSGGVLDAGQNPVYLPLVVR